MDVNSAVDRCEACLCSSLDPPALFSFTLHAFCICLSLLCLVLFELFACVVPIGCFRRGFFSLPSIVLKLYWLTVASVYQGFSSLSACCIVTENLQVQKEGLGRWKNICGKSMCLSANAKERLNMRQKEKAGGSKISSNSGFFRIIMSAVGIVLDLCWSFG